MSEGLALAYRRYSTDYVGQEQAAREARRGLWLGEFVKPWQWRKGKRMAGEKAADAAPGTCRIKGNISWNGNGSTIYQAAGTMRRPRSMKARVSGGSALRARQRMLVGDGRASDFAFHASPY